MLSWHATCFGCSQILRLRSVRLIFSLLCDGFSDQQNRTPFSEELIVSFSVQLPSRCMWCVYIWRAAPRAPLRSSNFYRSLVSYTISPNRALVLFIELPLTGRRVPLPTFRVVIFRSHSMKLAYGKLVLRSAAAHRHLTSVSRAVLNHSKYWQRSVRQGKRPSSSSGQRHRC